MFRTLAHLSRKSLARRQRGDEVPRYRDVPLQFSGYMAGGDEINAPVCYVIDVGRHFIITEPEGRLCLLGDGKAKFQEFTSDGLLAAAKQGWFGFTLLYDAEHDDVEEASATA